MSNLAALQTSKHFTCQRRSVVQNIHKSWIPSTELKYAFCNKVSRSLEINFKDYFRTSSNRFRPMTTIHSQGQLDTNIGRGTLPYE